MSRLSLVLLVALAGCTSKAEIELDHKASIARLEVFKECMSLAAKLERKADDDVADVVSACSNQAWYMTNYLRRQP